MSSAQKALSAQQFYCKFTDVSISTAQKNVNKLEIFIDKKVNFGGFIAA